LFIEDFIEFIEEMPFWLITLRLTNFENNENDKKKTREKESE
jgi:hypothetical protein